MKKLLTTVCLAMLSLAIVSCKDDTPSATPKPEAPHQHSFLEGFEHDAKTHWHKCAEETCSAIEGKVAHRGGTATCLTQKVCIDCGTSYGDLASHTTGDEWVVNEQGHYKVCSVEGCGAKVNEEEHKGGEATTTEKAVCEVCGESYGELLVEEPTHNYDLSLYDASLHLTLPTDVTEGQILVPCSDENCTSTHKVVLPLFNAENYETILNISNDVASYKVRLTEAARNGIVEADEVLLDADLQAALSGDVHTLKPSENGKQYVVVVNGQDAEYSKLVDANNDLAFSLHLNKGDKIHLYDGQGQLLSNVTPAATPKEIVSANGNYNIYVKYLPERLEDIGIWPDLQSADKCTSYTLKVNGVENTTASVEAGTDYAKWSLSLQANDVITVWGDGVALSGNGIEGETGYEVKNAATFDIYVNVKNEVSLVSSNEDEFSMTLRYYNTNNWTEVSAYMFGSNEALGKWPGTAMTAVNGKTGWFEIKVEKASLVGYTIIFNNNNNGSQTGNIVLSDENLFFYGSASTGYASEEAVLQAIEDAATKEADIKLSLDYWTSSSSAKLYAYVWGTGVADKWVELTLDSDSATDAGRDLYSAVLSDITFEQITGMKIVRFNPEGFVAPGWEDGNIWNQSGDIGKETYNTNIGVDGYSVNNLS